MEFKDRLKRLRRERHISQRELAAAIFVSRSAVAKWENGLGLPSPDSLVALSDFFKTDITHTEGGEEISLKKNRFVFFALTAIKTAAVILLFAFSALLSASVFSDTYGLFPSLAAGAFSDNEYYDCGDYIIYYDTMTFIDQNKEEHEVIHAFRPLRKILIGYKLYDEDYYYREVLLADTHEKVGRIYSIKGNNGYYNLIFCRSINAPSTELIIYDELQLGEESYAVEHSAYFVSEICPTGFIYIGGYKLLIDDRLIIPNAHLLL